MSFDQLELVAEELLKRETLDAEAFGRLIGRKVFDENVRPPAIEAAPQSLAKI